MHHECILCNHGLESFFFLKGEYSYEKMHEKDPDGEHRSCDYLFCVGGERLRMIVCMNTV